MFDLPGSIGRRSEGDRCGEVEVKVEAGRRKILWERKRLRGCVVELIGRIDREKERGDREEDAKVARDINGSLVRGDLVDILFWLNR